jgi:hypothetical protein
MYLFSTICIFYNKIVRFTRAVHPKQIRDWLHALSENVCHPRPPRLRDSDLHMYYRHCCPRPREAIITSVCFNILMYCIQNGEASEEQDSTLQYM